MNSDWLERWKKNDAPWQLAQAEPLLVQHFPKKPSQNILVPLCGKSVDMLWLKDGGHKVFGIELSEIASRSFFIESKIEYKTHSSDGFEIYESEKIKIWCGDFFDITKDMLPPLDLIYDRAALIALPPELRKKYAERIIEISKTCGSENFEILVILREGIKSPTEGPPFYVSSEELSSLYNGTFNIKILETMTKTRADDPSVKVIDTAYLLTIK